MLYIFLLFLAMALWMSKLYYILFKIANFSIELIINYNFLFFRYVLYSIWKLYFNIRFILILCGFAGLFTTTLFIFFTTATWTWWYVIYSIINIMNIIDISVESKQGNIYIYSTFSTNNILNIHLLQTNWKHCLHSFTELIIPYIYINTNMQFSIPLFNILVA